MSRVIGYTGPTLVLLPFAATMRRLALLLSPSFLRLGFWAAKNFGLRAVRILLSPRSNDAVAQSRLAYVSAVPLNSRQPRKLAWRLPTKHLEWGAALPE
jgi:hypothetical protein